jgi:tRNA A37 threonylcarbamoyladenosine biosynthesis protein TsaE
MGVDDYLYSGNWCFIEWAEKIPNLIPVHSVITISLLPDGTRSFTKIKNLIMNMILSLKSFLYRC